MKKKYSLTLLEIMIVIFLIGLIGSVIGYNMKGSLDEGKAFRTEQAVNQIHDVLLMEIAKGALVDDVVQHPANYLSNSGLVKDPRKLLKDGWGEEFVITPRGKSDIYIVSERYKKYKSNKRSKLGLTVDNEEDDYQNDEE